MDIHASPTGDEISRDSDEGLLRRPATGQVDRLTETERLVLRTSEAQATGRDDEAHVATPVLTFNDGRMDTGDVPDKGAHTSFSQLSTYLRCSMQYYYQRVKKAPDRSSLALKLGSAGHAALEWNDKKKIKSGADQPLPDLLDMFSDHYDAETAELEKDEIKPGEDLGKTKDAAAQALVVYHKQVAPKVRPIMVEKEFDLDLMPTDDYQYPLKIVNGRIDLITIDGVWDRKWTSRMKPQGEVDASYQLSLYELWYRMTYKEVPENVGLQVFVPATTKNAANVKNMPRSPEERPLVQRQARWRQLVHTMRTAQRGIDAGIFIPTNDPMKCANCAYRKVCQSSLAKSDLEAIAILQKGHNG